MGGHQYTPKQKVYIRHFKQKGFDHRIIVDMCNEEWPDGFGSMHKTFTLQSIDYVTGVKNLEG